MAICRLLDKIHIENLLKSTENFLFDCDGVLWNGSNLINGSKEVIIKLKQLGKRVFLLSNNSSRSRKQYEEKCTKLGVPVKLDEIFCTSYGAALYLHNRHFKGKVYLVGNNDFASELTNLGIPYIGPGTDYFVENTTSEDLSHTRLDPDVNCVVVGFDPHISYMKTMKAASYASLPDCLFIATNEDPSLPMPGGIVIPGTGTIVAPIKLATGLEPIVIGKPSTCMVDMLAKLHDIDVSKSVMIGDRLSTDIAMANRCQIPSIFVQTGASSIEDVRKCETDPTPYNRECIPTFYTQSVADIYDMLSGM